MRRRTIFGAAARGLVVTMLAVAGLVAGATGVDAQTNPYERGPNPTSSSIRASSGPFSVSTTSVSSAVSGFGGGTIYYPTTTSEGTFGAVVIAPGYTASSTTYSGIARRVASHGFVTFAINTNSRYDFPPSRGTQILRALDYLTQSSSVRSRIDTSRLAVSGHSMGGGGTLEAANSRSSLKAAVPLQPWHSDKTWPGVSVPTMIIGAESDSVAPVSSHSISFYNSIPSSTQKAYVELNNESHFAAGSNPADQGAAMVTWLKKWVDNDARYNQFLCPAPSSSDYSDWRVSYSCDGGGGTPPPEDDCQWWQWWC
jgi:predicted dienelactone hydrolase